MDPTVRLVVPVERKYYNIRAPKHISCPIYRRPGIKFKSIASPFTAKNPGSVKKAMRD